eukprot:GFKZ01005100.1.p1 GENE.GFKZ01005100.1~~GFKZ01005100.1.p1  ORF type:complete len:425 (+),score=63.86 GFKZ01005100.1:374-1648(+)
MQSTAFRRVLKSLSPKKRNNSPPPAENSCPNPTVDASSPMSSSAIIPDPAIADAASDQYSQFLSRLSVRLDQSPHLSRSPSPPPASQDRSISRLHRRAMRDITIPHLADVNANEREIGTEGASSFPALPPMHVNVDPRGAFAEFEAVGNGASGSVFFAKRKDNGQTVALKRVRPSTRAKSRALENEIRTMHVLRHENIVQCHEAYSWGGSVWIVMEAMDIGCLTRVLEFLRWKKYLLSEAHIAYILRETIRGVWAMHSGGRLHRDIKSDNVLVSSEGEIKLADFEYTAVLTEETPKRNTVVGTAWWMAPETVRSSYYDYGADVWSIGILSVECAEWVPPLFGMESAKAMEVIRQGETTQGFKRPDMWSVEFADFVRGCLTRERELRYSVPDLLRHPFLEKACTRTQIANVFRAVRGMEPITGDE